MPTLEITNLWPPARIAVSAGQSLLAALHGAGLDWRHQCGGKGRCTSCVLTLTHGAELLVPLTAPEERFRAVGRLPAPNRLCCQATLVANTPINAVLAGTVPPEGRLPHLTYTE